MADNLPPSHALSTVFMRRRRLGVTLLILVGWAIFPAVTTFAQDIERDPINYSTATPKNAISRFQERLAAGTAKLEYEPEQGYLRSLLRALDVPESSQMLVFSKSSLQRDRISPKTPRAIYFSDDVMVGYCYRGQVIEISAPDEVIGTAFYTVDQTREEETVLQQQTESCLVCHSSSVTRGFPGSLVRSLFVDRQGFPCFPAARSAPTTRARSPSDGGGWYVTGTSGKQTHMGNMICEGPNRPDDVDNADGVNVVDLKDRFTTSFYPEPTSDIVALMVLEHQVGMLNRLARAGMETRMALHYEAELNKALGQPATEHSTSARSRIRSVGEAVVKYMLFDEEALLTDRVEGTSTFAADFSKRGPRDSKGRSLRDLDLKARLFRYPCSYLIYSRAFDSLPGAVKDHVYERLWGILDGGKTEKDDPVLTEPDRQAILEILRETKPDLPDYWKTAKAPSEPASE